MILFFYLFSSLILLSSILVVISVNPVYSMLWLIFAFCNSAGLMILLGAEFISMMLIIVYVGAVAVLFLFIIMMLTTRSKLYIHTLTTKNKIYSLGLGLFLLIDLSIIIYLGLENRNIHHDLIDLNKADNVFSIGNVLYTKFILPFQVCGIILFAAMISSIYLTKRIRNGVKKQNINNQILRNKENSIKIEKIPYRQGIEGINYNE